MPLSLRDRIAFVEAGGRIVGLLRGHIVDSYDLIVIGSGPAGRRAAIQAAKLGHSVLVVENRLRVGGVSELRMT